MAVTFTITNTKVYTIGDRKEVIADVAVQGTPQIGGDTLTASMLGLDLELDFVLATPLLKPDQTQGVMTAVYHPSATPSSVLVFFYVQGTAGNTNPMVPFNSNMTNWSMRVRAVGKGPAVV